MKAQAGPRLACPRGYNWGEVRFKGASGPPVTGFLPSEANFSLSWDDAWPQVEGKVRLALLRKGTPPDLVDDAVQEAGLQAWRRPERFDSLEGLLRWVTRVAWRVVTAEYRRRQRVCVTAALDITDAVDPARIVEGRLKLQAVRDGLAQLNCDQRSAVLSQVTGDVPADHRERARVKERRHRGRRELRKTVGWAGDDPG